MAEHSFAELAQRSLEILEETGWSHQTPYGENGKGCLVITVFRAANSLGARSVLPFFRVLKDRVGPLIPWNDAPERTYEDVVGLLSEIKETHGGH